METIPHRSEKPKIINLHTVRKGKQKKGRLAAFHSPN
jgi:hypothetical protein